ncbi:dTDP-4-dehydrorhamnose reductase [Providencia rettgeri]|uniref:dTDP-4-dehydrorhamnose reductase n=1 Tax=Providencia rettgeri TaxID=587 RepID=UPI0035267254
MNVLITGSQGQLGHCLVDLLSKCSEINVAAYNKKQLDVTNELQVKQLLNEFKPDVIINAAAYTSVDQSESNIKTCYAINRDGPRYLAKIAKELDSLLIHISTDYVFDGEKNEPYVETDIPNPLNVYGQSKLAGEIAVMEHCSRYIIIRTSWVFGEHGNNFVKTMLHLSKNRPKINIIGDQVGGPTYVRDIAKAIIAIIGKFSSSNLSGIYHFAGEPYVSWYQFAEVIFQTAKRYGCLSEKPTINKITTIDYPLPAKRPANSRLNCLKINTVFGINPSNWNLALQNIQAYQS